MIKHHHNKGDNINNRYGNYEGGFTLIEVMVALVILCVGLLGLAELQVITIKANKQAQSYTSATILAEAKIEELKEKFSDPNFSNGSFEDTNNPINGVEGTGGIFTRSWEISNYSGSGNMKEIVVTVCWLDGNHSISLNTVLSDTIEK